jgi:glucose-6-phosphate isomerase
MSAASEKTTLSKQVLSFVHHAIDEHLVKRIWEKDPKVWKDDPKIGEAIGERLGWLDVPDFVLSQYKEITAFAKQVCADGFTSVVVLGMGGSSLCVEVIRDTYGPKEGYPRMLVLDSTHPDQVGDIEHAVDLDHTLFIVASKSGTTLEPNCYCQYFWEKLAHLGDDRRLHFCAITDPGTPLEKISDRDKFRHTFSNPPDIGGRYSVLSYFGMVPAALMGVDIEELLSRASSEAGQNHTEEERNAGLVLGAFLGNGAKIGRDKLTIVADPELRSFGYWAEQLIAESTGKEGKGILPIEGESELAAEEQSNHRLYVHLTYGEHSLDEEEREKPYHLELHIMENAGLGAQFFRWEFATALAGHYLGINPFDEPNVAESKAKTNEMLDGYDGKTTLKYSGGESPVDASTPRTLEEFISQHATEDSYIAIMAYINRTKESISALQTLRKKLSLKYHVPVTVGFGPRFLHSTGQLHKGGPATGIFIQLTDTPKEDRAIPGKPYTFGTLILAQAIGDFEVLKKHERPAIHFDLGTDAITALPRLS